MDPLEPCALASTRSAALSLAEAARGLAASSASSGRSRAAGQQPELGTAGRQRTGSPWRGRIGRSLAQRPLHDPVLERVVGEHGDPAANGDGVQRGGDGPPERAELIVDLDP